MFGKVSNDSFRDIFESTLFDDRFEVSDHYGSYQGSQKQSKLGLHHFNERGVEKLAQTILDERKNTSTSPQPTSKVNASRYKTELCRPFQESGVCKYGEKCQFAHGEKELRNINRHPKYKTDLCRTYHSVGFCPYGPRCHFIHNLEELKERQAPTSLNMNNTNTEEMPPLPMFSFQRSRNASDVGSISGSSTKSSPSLELSDGDVLDLSFNQNQDHNSNRNHYYRNNNSNSNNNNHKNHHGVSLNSRLPIFTTLSK
ncbi:hypothetical protein TCAL_01089 [Tigriopus californicus]|uniref:C3H1-type domain-containing protein n=1 Tax=Tigriopus californicus TaxID=6832 RepID=A0A553P3C8_TIGCA|nr:protein TIS11-like [Tigriopus californicus]TRY72206.1 hypothetical protein TCAL_01089 [Tigriopus californicus]|eukprot:TCALIF_01089-PA protein Name:"Similar to zfp36l2-A Zinc finger protein 36, C3H1 type-like 2-A (Xenopus laevis)" AED:0.00 eAED:0.00 QI:130/1/1/1/1/1/2/83/255